MNIASVRESALRRPVRNTGLPLWSNDYDLMDAAFRDCRIAGEVGVKT
jgi:hypothetical protein